MFDTNKAIQELLAGTEKRAVYLDHAATTPVDKRVFEAMQPYFSENFGNPGGFYDVGKVGADAVEAARGSVAEQLGCEAEEVIFTSGGTESDNLAILGVARAWRAKNPVPDGTDRHGHIITSAIEHHAVEMPCKQLEREGFDLTILPVDEYGRVQAEDVRTALREDTVLVSVMMANNEIGTLQPIAEIAEVIRNRNEASDSANVIFHTDACQAAGASDLDVQKLGVDLMTINGGKIYGPKGVGVLYRRKGVRLKSLMYGGYQERGLRPGTENVPGIVGFAKALELAQGDREAEAERLIELRDYMIAEFEKRVPKVRLNGHATERLPNNVNITFMDIEGESLILFLNELGISAATGSACTSESLDPSHVIVATGVPYECAHGSIRFSLGRKTSRADIDYVLEVLPKIVEILRKISPLNLDPDNLESNLDSPLHDN
jgi:cysteine desulfurase